MGVTYPALAAEALDVVEGWLSARGPPPADLRPLLTQHVLPALGAYLSAASASAAAPGAGDVVEAPIEGGDGNREFLLAARKT